MKKFTISLLLLITLFASGPVAFGVANPPPTANSVPITSTNTVPSMVNPGAQNFQPGQAMPKLREKIAQHPRLAKKIMNFRRNHQPNQTYQRAPKIVRWISMGIKFITFLLFWILLIVLLILAIRWAIKSLPHIMNINQPKAPLDILKERLVKGEITPEQFEELKAKLS